MIITILIQSLEFLYLLIILLMTVQAIFNIRLRRQGATGRTMLPRFTASRAFPLLFSYQLATKRTSTAKRFKRSMISTTPGD